MRKYLILQLVCWFSFTGLLRADVPSPLLFTNRPAAGPNDGEIAYWAARLLERYQYLHHDLDQEFGEKFFDGYLDMLDPEHMLFTQQDLAGFNSYRTNLSNLTLDRRGMADVRPAFDIYARFMDRMEERTAYEDAMLKTNQFVFNDQERIERDRRQAPYPKDLDEARQLWKQHLRYDYLQEKIARVGAKKKVVTPESRAVMLANGTNAASSPDLKPKTEAEEIAEVLAQRYSRRLRLFREFDNDDIMGVYVTALARVYDPHSDYLPKSQADSFAINMSLSLFGIGAELKSEDGYCIIAKLHPGPAMKSKKIKEGDRIVAVAQGTNAPVDVVDMSLNKTVQLIRGPKDTEVRLTVIPVDSPAQRRVISLVRDEIKLEDEEAKAKIVEIPNDAGKPLRLGVIDLNTFYATVNLNGAGDSAETTPRSTSADIARLLKKLKEEDVSGIILDLRFNGGGSLEEAIRLTGLFIKDGPVVQVRAPEGPPLVEEDPDPSIAYDGPLIILTSRYSASASEILAGALQDYGRALIVGDLSTHGKGTVQNVNPLAPWVRPMTPSATNDPGALKLTIRKFYRVGGASTQLKGVLSDIVLPDVLNYDKDIGESALPNAMAWDTLPSADFDKVDMVTSYLPDLVQRSSQRVATNQDFKYIREDIDLYRKEQADKTISLNEQENLKEKKEADARKAARDKERQSRPPLNVKIYDLRLANVDQPGLPAPEGVTNATAAASAILTNPFPSTATSDLKPASPASPADADEESDDAKGPAVDPMLDETERILEDYISLMVQKGVVASH